MAREEGRAVAASFLPRGEGWVPVGHFREGTKMRTDLADGDRDKEENFTILYRSRCPACLTENLFQDNREDVDYLLSDAGREAIVRLHVDGIKDYIAKYGGK